MPTVELTAGPIDYEDSGGDGPVLVFLGGVLMDGSVWHASGHPSYPWSCGECQLGWEMSHEPYGGRGSRPVPTT